MNNFLAAISHRMKVAAAHVQYVQINVLRSLGQASFFPLLLLLSFVEGPTGRSLGGTSSVFFVWLEEEKK